MKDINLWQEKAKELLEGRTITEAKYIPDDDWGYALVLILDDGKQVFVQSDDEGNAAGALCVQSNSDDYEILPRL